jgi:hypothetical protein
VGERRRLLAALAIVLGLLLVATTDPGAGTGVNLHGSDDVAALVAGDHHAKPIPVTTVARDVALAAVALLVVLIVLVSTPTPVAVERDVTRPGLRDRSSVAARRGPPAFA